MQNDADLLRCYADSGSENAFAELVRRHLNFVYAAALRLVVGDVHLAQDVAQIVFTDLARKATMLANRPVLTGWLYTSTRFAAAKAIRTARRRQTREREAYLMQDLTTDTTGDADWERLRPVIDDALQALNEGDREAVLMRYFEGRPFPEIGLKFSVSADAARLRVERALEKMRVALARGGVSSTTAALAIALANQPILALPAGLAGAVTGGALAGAMAGGGGLVATLMNITTLQIGTALAVIAAGTAGFMIQAKADDGIRAEIAVLQEQLQDFTRLRDENKTLVRAAADVEMLRIDGAELARLREEVAGARRLPRPVPPAQAELSRALLPAIVGPNELIAINFPSADIDTVLATIEMHSGYQIVRPVTLGGGIIQVHTGKVTRAEGLELLRTALRNQAGVTLEPGPNGTVLARRSGGR